MQHSVDSPMPPDTDIILSLIESLPLHVFAKDREGRFIHGNGCYCRRIGLALEQLIGLDDFDIHPRELAEKYRHDDARIMETGRIESLEEPWKSSHEGSEINWIQTIKAPLRLHGSQEIIGMIGVFWDITEKKLGEIALAEERNLLRTLIDNLPDYIYVKDLESRFLVANVAVARLMGASSPDKLLGKRDRDYYPDIQAKEFREDEKEVVASGLPVIDKEECLTDFSGRMQWLLTTKVPLKNIHGDIAGIIGIGHNITEQREAELERKRLEDQLHHAQRMETIGTLTAGIAHDFNNLLSVINGYTELIQLTTPLDHKNHENLGRVLTAGRSAARLIAQLLAFSRKQVAQSRVINLNRQLVSTRTMLKRIIGENVSIRLELGKQLWPVRMDPAQLEQIVVNMAANARDAMPDGGELLLKTENVVVDEAFPARFPSLAPGEWVLLSIKDTGEGLTPTARDHLFEPFFTTKPKHQGTGLGLATVFGIIKQNKGHIFADSRPGEGAEFAVYLPKSEEQEQPMVGDAVMINRSYRGTETILVVEDDPDVQKLACTMLSDQGYTVYTARNGAEAILAIEEKGRDIRLILTDVIMPGINGRMLADEIARRKVAAKVLFMSGYTDETISKYGILEPGVEFIQKPFSTGELVRKVRVMLDELTPHKGV